MQIELKMGDISTLLNALNVAKKREEHFIAFYEDDADMVNSPVIIASRNEIESFDRLTQILISQRGF